MYPPDRNQEKYAARHDMTMSLIADRIDGSSAGLAEFFGFRAQLAEIRGLPEIQMQDVDV